VSIALTRQGHDVVVLDRASPPPDVDADEVFDRWTSEGVGHHRQPHNFLGLGRAVLRDRLPDIYQALLDAGATEIDQAAFLGDAPPEPDDVDLATLACRRPVFDAVLRRALPEMRPAEVTGITVENGRVVGVTTDGGAVAADLVLDVGGRGTRVPEWLAAAGHPQPLPQRGDCGLLYYSRHYRVPDAEPFPAYASILAGPRGDLGYLSYACFLGDNRTFCLCVMVPPSDKPFRGLRDVAAFERLAAQLPGMAAWLAVADPITGVLPMGHLHNVLRPTVDVPGLIALGDARCHTNPTFALGASLSIAHAVLLADLCSKTADLTELSRRFAAETDLDLQARYDAVRAEDGDRTRIWGGEPIDVTNPDDTMPFYLRSVVYRVAPQDPALLRAVLRRVNALDPVDQLESDPALMARAQQLYDGSLGAVAVPPPRTQLLDALVDA
jgi:2-polyprenyl-6-methoxyphenol hydroxylase-like FAD-dependent oxidoreductase